MSSICLSFTLNLGSSGFVYAFQLAVDLRAFQYLAHAVTELALDSQLGTVGGPNIAFDGTVKHNMGNVDVTLDYTGLFKGQSIPPSDDCSLTSPNTLSIDVQRADEVNFPDDLGTLANDRAILQ